MHNYTSYWCSGMNHQWCSWVHQNILFFHHQTTLPRWSNRDCSLVILLPIATIHGFTLFLQWYLVAFSMDPGMVIMTLCLVAPVMPVLVLLEWVFCKPSTANFFLSSKGSLALVSKLFGYFVSFLQMFLRGLVQSTRAVKYTDCISAEW